ncbi:hypothetical protein SAMN02745220_04742 [Desulfopila aestuarii DSM 18488]|uniref:Uncharacterized protein n=1 Tax=Desulfopila aestuarii DSM 18488 TaxID=1121416 RepID=A0A1M7YJI9_9BACT|nr:hypothetical protein SAMN02745220_04742 [Desulfopila aestuarii DSM 18488]
MFYHFLKIIIDYFVNIPHILFNSARSPGIDMIYITVGPSCFYPSR